MRVVEHWNRWPRAVVESPFVDTLTGHVPRQTAPPDPARAVEHGDFNRSYQALDMKMVLPFTSYTDNMKCPFKYVKSEQTL